MKKFALFTAMAAIAIAFTSCDNRPNVLGAWEGVTRINQPGDQTQMTTTLDFGKDGTVAASFVMTMELAVPQTETIVTPYEASITGTANMTGTWQYVDREDDEIALKFDPSTLSVNVDPEAVSYRADVFTGEQAPDLETLTPTLIERYKAQMAKYVQTSGFMQTVLDDVKVEKPLLKFEINDIDYVFHAQ